MLFTYIWNAFLYQPLFNALIWIYSNIADHNLGWAVVWLTIFLRILLLPLTIVSELTAVRRRRALEEAEKAILAYKNDHIAQKEVVRKIVRRYHISPWAKVASLGIQLLVLILLYQVFIRGISGQRIFKVLYPWLDYPGKINTVFYGFEIGKIHDWLWAGIAALYLLISIIIEKRAEKKNDKNWDKSEMYFLLFFPLFTFAILWYLPMVKSLFILTTMVFSDIISGIVAMCRWMFKAKPKPAH